MDGRCYIFHPCNHTFILNDFDTIAPHYDWIAKAVFGNAIKDSQEVFLSKIPANSKVLILGGGSGWIVHRVLEYAQCVSITYVEKSKKMIELTQARLSRDELKSVNFVQGSFEKLEIEEPFDVVITPFFLDVFDKSQLRMTIDKIKSILKKNGLLIVADFQINDTLSSKSWQKPLLWFMHLFFWFISQLESNQLQDINAEILQRGFVIQYEELFFGKAIFSSVYRIVALEGAIVQA